MCQCNAVGLVNVSHGVGLHNNHWQLTHTLKVDVFFVNFHLML